MITIIIDNVSDWERLREKFHVEKKETFYTLIEGYSQDKSILMWFLKDNMQYSVRCAAPLFSEAIKAKVHDSE